MSHERDLRAAIVYAFERIPVADRGWNERVADQLMADEKFLAAVGRYEGPAEQVAT